MPSVPFTVEVVAPSATQYDSVTLYNRSTNETLLGILDSTKTYVFTSTEFSKGVTAGDILEISLGGADRLAPGSTLTCTAPSDGTAQFVSCTREATDNTGGIGA